MAPGANGNFLERSEGRYAPPGLSEHKGGRLCPRGLSSSDDWGIIKYSHPVLKDSAQGVAIAERCIWNIRLLINVLPMEGELDYVILT